MDPKLLVFHTQPDFDVAKTPDATLFVLFVGEKSAPYGEASQTNSQ